MTVEPIAPEVHMRGGSPSKIFGNRTQAGLEQVAGDRLEAAAQK